MDGTRSFSRHLGRLEAEKTEFAQLLQRIDPGFTTHTVLPAAVVTFARRDGPLPMGCLIDSWLALQDLLARDVPVHRARLLSFYVRQGGGLAGHTVLAYETVLGVHVIDRAVSPTPRLVDGDLDDELAITRQLLHPQLRHRLVKARWCDLDVPESVSEPTYADAASPVVAPVVG
jgi:hypothetical protein